MQNRSIFIAIIIISASSVLMGGISGYLIADHYNYANSEEGQFNDKLETLKFNLSNIKIDIGNAMREKASIENSIEPSRREIDGLNSVLIPLRSEKAKYDAIHDEYERLHDKNRYAIKIEVGQSNFTIDIRTHIKNAMNKAEFWISVDRATYDGLNVGTVLNRDFRLGSAILKGSYGNWNIKVVDKRIIQQ